MDLLKFTQYKYNERTTCSTVHIRSSINYMVYVHLLGSTWWYTDQWVHRCQQVSSMSVHTYPSKVTWPHRLLQSLKEFGALLGRISWALYDVLGLPNFQNPLHSEQQIWSGTLFVVLTLPRCMVNLHKGHHILLLLTKKLPYIFIGIGMFTTYVHIKFHTISHTVVKFDYNIQNSIRTFCVSVTLFHILSTYGLHEVTLFPRSVTISTEFHSKSSLQCFHIQRSNSHHSGYQLRMF